MVANHRDLFLLIIAKSILFQGIICSVEIPKESCAVNEVSKKNSKSNLSIGIKKWGSIWSNAESTFGCPCGEKLSCVPSCCPEGNALGKSSCIVDNITSGVVPTSRKIDKEFNFSQINYHLYEDDPCSSYEWMVSSVLKDFHLAPNGSISDGWRLIDSEHYCLFRNFNSTVYAAKICRPMPYSPYDIFCLMTAGLIMFVMIICYSIVPELKNLHGLIFRAYLFTYVILCCGAVGMQFTTGLKTKTHVYSSSVMLTRYCVASCAFWLNVMSFNIWQSIRSSQTVGKVGRKSELKKFIWLAIYAWFGPAVVIMFLILSIRYVPFFPKDTVGNPVTVWTTVVLIAAIFGCNCYMYTSTALKISQHKKETSHLVDRVNRHNFDTNKLWFNLHVKLFLIMGGHMAIWAVWIRWPTPILSRIEVTAELLQSCLLFYMFLWKDSIKQSLRERIRSGTDRFRSALGIQSAQLISEQSVSTIPLEEGQSSSNNP